MKTTRKEIQVFSVSFLDVLSCALGGVLLLLLLNMNNAHLRAKSDEKQIEGMKSQIDDALANLSALHDSLEVVQRDADAQKKAKDELERAQAALIGFEGPMGNVVFIFDTSGSMATSRFPAYRKMLQEWIRSLQYDTFNVIEFGDAVDVWMDGKLISGKDKANRERAIKWVEGLKPDGGSTNTLSAFSAAFSLDDETSEKIDTLILMSDGQPDQPMDDIHDWLAHANSTKKIVINCVAMGNYFRTDPRSRQVGFGEFLRQIADNHRGRFLGR